MKYLFATFLVFSFSTYGAAQRVTPTRAPEYDWRNVWRPQEWELWRNVHEKCGPGGGFGAWRSSAAKIGIRQTRANLAFTNCVASRLAREGASAESIQFVRQKAGEVYMGSFREMGKVDLATTVAPLWNDPNVEDFILVNGSPRIVYLWPNVENIDITRDRLYPSLKRQFPEMTMWPMHGFMELRPLSDGGQRFVFSFVLLNGCRACDLAGSAEIAFDFAQSGRFLGANLLQLTRSEEKDFKQVTVRNFKEFLAAIAPNTSISLEPGDYIVDKSTPSNNPYVVWTTDQQGREQHGLTIRNVDRLFISGPSEKGTARFLQPDESLAVMIFENSSNINIHHLVAGHSPSSTWCWAGVLTFYDSKNINIWNSEVYGSGLYGLTLDNVRDLEFGQSTIRDCTYKIAEIKNSDNVTFSDSKFVNNGSSDLIEISKSSNIVFDRMTITKNRSTDNGQSLFLVENSKNVTLSNSTIRENSAGVFEHVKGSIAYDRSNKIDFTQFRPSDQAGNEEAERWRRFIRDQFSLLTNIPPPKRDLRELLIFQTWGKFDTYSELYLLAINRRSLASDALSAADAFLKRGDIPNAKKYAGQSTKYYVQSNELFNNAEQVFAGSVAMTAQTLNAIYRGTAETSRYGWTLACGPKCGEIADYVLLMTDYAVDYSIEGADQSKRNALAHALTKALLSSSGMSAWVETRATLAIGSSGLYGFLDRAISSPEFQKSVMKVLAESGAYAANELMTDIVRKSIQSELEFLRRSRDISPRSAGQQNSQLQDQVQTVPLRLTPNPAQDRDPAWSPDGTTIVFISNRIGGDDGFDLFAINPDGSNERLLLQFAMKDQYGGRFGHPSWLNSGDLLVLESKNFWEAMRFGLRDASNYGEVPVRRSEFNDNSPYLTRLLFVPGGQGAGSPIASPTGASLIWHALVSPSTTGENGRVYEVRVLPRPSGFSAFLGNSDSVGRVLLRTSPGGMIDGPKSLAISPDGSKICIAANLGGWHLGKRRDLFIIDLTTGTTQRLTHTGETGSDNAYVSWSSKNVIAFASRANDKARYDLHSIRPDGTDIKQLTNSQWDEIEPSWSPQGDQIVFSSNKETQYDLYVMKYAVSGSNQDIRLAATSGAPMMPTGEWLGEWNDNDGNHFSFEMRINQDSENVLTASIVWTLRSTRRADLQRKIRLTAVEHLHGTYQLNERLVKLRGYRKDDPHAIIALDNYNLIISTDGKTLSGQTETNGTWEGRLSATKKN